MYSTFSLSLSLSLSSYLTLSLSLPLSLPSSSPFSSPHCKLTLNLLRTKTKVMIQTVQVAVHVVKLVCCLLPSLQVCHTLEQYPFQSLCPSEKTKVLAFLVDQLLDSSTLCREIDNRMEQISTLRREKWKISLKLKR